MSQPYTLEQLGWSSFYEAAFSAHKESGLVPGRVSVQSRDHYEILTPEGAFPGRPTGKLLFSASAPAELPKVGDWAAVAMFESENKVILHHVLPRKTRFSRKVPGRKTEEQVLVANVDLIFVVQSLDHDFSVNRIERSLVMIREGGAEPGIILNKVDVCPDTDAAVAQIQRAGLGVPVLLTSAKANTGIQAILDMLETGRTYAFVGSSGVGKSSLINCILGEDLLKTQSVRINDDKGRHTTTRRQLLVLPQGGLVIDTPGMRELQLWQASDGLLGEFADITDLGQGCRFSDCTHSHEVGCAVLKAVADGALSPGRYEHYLKLVKEQAFLETRSDQKVFLEKKQKDKVMHKAWRRELRLKRRR